MEEGAVIEVKYMNPLIDAVRITGNTDPHFVAFFDERLVNGVRTDFGPSIPEGNVGV
jgi:hypothetical protein